MSDELEQRAERARTSLYEKYRELSDLWQQAEAQLTGYHLPHGVCCEFHTVYDDEQPDMPIGEQCIGIQKFKNEWRICYGDYSCCGPECEPSNWRVIDELPVELRTRLVDALPKLREKIVTSSERFIPRVESAIDKLKKFVVGNMLATM